MLDRYRRFSILCGLMTLLLASSVLAGWVFHIENLVRGVAHYPGMKINAALCFLLLGGSIVALNSRKKFSWKKRSPLVTTACVFALLIAVLTLLEYLLDANFHIDELFVADTLGDPKTPPGRMAMITAINLILISSSLLLLTRSARSRSLSQGLALVTFLLSALSALGLLFGAESLPGIYPYSGIAIPTIIVFIFLSLGSLFSRPDEGFVSVFTSSYFGGQAARQLLPLSLITLLIVGYLFHQGGTQALFDRGTSVTFIVALEGAVISTLIWWNAKKLNSFSRSNIESLKATRASEKQSRELAYQLKLIIEHAPGAVAMLDNQMRYIWVSARWISDFHLRDQDFVGRSHYEIFPDIPERWKEIHRRCLAGATERSEEDPFERTDGTLVWLRWEVRPWHREDGSIGGVLIFSEDISRWKLAEDALKKINEGLEARVGERTQEVISLFRKERNAVRTREEVLAMVSHDLKNPLQALLLNAQMLGVLDTQSPMTSSRLKTISERLIISVQQMQRLIAGILDFAKIQAGTFGIAPKLQSLEPLIRSTMETLGLLASARSIDLREKIEPGLPPIAYDFDRMAQVLSNLVGNAIKFTPAGGRIELRASRVGSEIQFSIADTGPGIAPDHLPHIFDRYWQAQEAAPLGTGLGLSIAKGIVVAHHGRIWAESTLGQGSTFYFSLPLPQPSDAQSQARAES